ncbi:MAG: hypothetical protein ACREID_02500 [Planctomycetota bacterium]
MRRNLPAAAALLAACVSTSSSRSGKLSTDIFEDIPAPREASYRDAEGESFSYRCKSWRCGRFVYDLRGKEADATRFYRETMASPPYSWTLMEQQGEEAGSSRLVFAKNDDRCTVDIDRYVVGPQGNDSVVIRVRVNYSR